MKVFVTQYMRPDGRKVQANTELPDAIERTYMNMLGAGCRFEAEVLTTGEVSVTVTNDEEDVDSEVVPNGPEVQAAMLRLLQRKAWMPEKGGGE